MGIYDFFGKFIRRLPTDVVTSLSGVNKVKSIEGLSFDVNAVLHSVAQRVYMYGEGGVKYYKSEEEFLEERLNRQKLSHTELENKFMDEMINEFSRIIWNKRISQYILLMVDGIAPNAKIQQQRSRRFKSAIELSEMLVSGNTNSVPIGGFNSSFISPGTPFMSLVSEKLSGWINKNRKKLPPIVILSTSDTPGEGEHKIFKAIRELKREGSIVQGTGPHVIWSLDSDLAIISSICDDIHNIYLARQRWDEVISVDSMRKEISKLLKGVTPSDLKDEQNLLRDFIVVSCLIGNDFLPRSILYPYLSDTVIKAYRDIGGYLTYKNKDNDSSTIIIKNLTRFFWNLAKTEKDISIDIVKKEIADEGTKDQRVEPTEVLRNSYNETTGVVDMKSFKQNIYTEAKNIYYDTYITQKLTKNENELSLNDFKNLMVENYYYGLEWVLKYYTGGDDAINWIYEYTYINAPLPSDIVYSLSTFDPNINLMDKYLPTRFGPSDIFGVTANDGWQISRGKTPLNMGLQLLAIIPNNILLLAFKGKGYSKEYLNLTSTKGPLGDFSPPTDIGTIKLYCKGKYKKFQCVPIIPQFDYFYFKHVIDELENVNYRKTYQKMYNIWKQINSDILEERANYERSVNSPEVNITWEGMGRMPSNLKGKKGKEHVPPVITFLPPPRKLESTVIPTKLQKIEIPMTWKSIHLANVRINRDDPLIKFAKRPDDVVVSLDKLYSNVTTTSINNKVNECGKYNIVSNSI